MATDTKYTRIKGMSDIRRLPRLGKIRLGIKKIAKSGKEYPAEVEYFVVPPEVARVYGEQPKSLDIMFPTEDEGAIFPQSYKWYVANGLRCKGNGETAMRRYADLASGERVPMANGGAHDANDLVEVACPCPLLESGDCRQNANLMVLLPKVSLGGVYQITTGSFHNIVRVNSCIDYVRAVVGRIALVPLVLTRQAEELQYEGKKATHHLLQIVLNVNLEEAASLRDNARLILAQTAKLALPTPVEDGPEPTGEAPVEAEIAAPAEPAPVNASLPPCEELVEQLDRASTVNQVEQLWFNITANPATSGLKIWAALTTEERQSLLATRNARLAAISRASVA